MSEAPRDDMYIPLGKTGAGHYGSTLGKQTSLVTNVLKDNILKLVKSIPFPDKKSVFNIGDYGTSDGSSSMTFLRDLLVTLKEQHGPDAQFQVIYEDKEINDFNSLFKRLMGIIPEPPSYLQELENVYPLASGIQFRKQCVPDDSMHMIMTWFAIQWISKGVTFKNSLWVYPDCSREEMEALKKQAQKDYELFLQLRSKELKHGGILLIVCPGKYVDEYDSTQFNLKTFVSMLIDVWQLFREKKWITSREFTKTNFEMSHFSLEEMQSPFQDASSLVYGCGLRLLSADVVHVPCVFYSAWKENMELTGTDDRQEFAKSYVNAHRNWSNNLFLAGLSESRTQEEKERIVDDLYYTVEKKVSLKNPEEFKNENIITYAIVTKE